MLIQTSFVVSLVVPSTYVGWKAANVRNVGGHSIPRTPHRCASATNGASRRSGRCRCTSALGASPYQRPAGIADDKEPLIVAGYRALFTCSAHFFAGRPLEDIKNASDIDTVIKNGVVYPADSILH